MPTSRNTVAAHIAFPDARRDRVVPFVLRNVKRTRLHAVTAAHAFAGFVKNGSFRGLGECPDRTNRYARRIFAVHAHTPDKTIIAAIYDCVGVSGKVVAQEVICS